MCPSGISFDSILIHWTFGYFSASPGSPSFAATPKLLRTAYYLLVAPIMSLLHPLAIFASCEWPASAYVVSGSDKVTSHG
ncbi:hypothetical protein BDV37DRAFT_245224 [Aspergillus pseudonomiae]|uniref:Uncharacterized protein n=1 Tax=Aspergillus pseudonomiae TaxID=1506151 RepID=A0A5N7DGZ8_9EURO|nr:uncharacterized protein BDV37DRAFT_245224 [Aspergillus pseudonomiae]KAE8405495.1 hypothetical protein BDV37DRAFT_245224 [Aspergillus pseudonomiae]